VAAVDPIASFTSRARRRPERAARDLVDSDSAVALALVQALERQLSAEPLRRLERVWQLSASQAAGLFGVSRQAYAKWHRGGVPAERRADVADLDAATAELLARVSVDRIPAVVRRPAAILGDRSLLEVAATHGAAAVRAGVEHAFDLSRVQP
jgi:hypothetical protein